MREVLYLMTALWMVSLPAFAGVSTPVLNEISAMGIRSFLDEDGEQEDWIEIYNPTGQTISLHDWSLTDNTAIPRKWIFPNVSIDPEDYLIVFASGKDRRPTTGNLHASFGLDTGGESLCLYDDSGTLVDSFAPEFPPQRNGYSYGLHPLTGEQVFFTTMTPGEPNESEGSFPQFLAETVQFSVPRGIYENHDPFMLELNVEDAQAEIRYTTDYTTPTVDNGAVYQSPIQISENTTIRAGVFKEGFGPSWVETHTYFFSLTDQQKTLPIMVVVTDPLNLDGPEGLRTGDNAQERGRHWERPVSMEYFDLNSPAGEQIDGGIRIHGGAGRSRGKKSYRLYFRQDYGDPELTFLPIPGTPVQTFKRIVLRAGAQDLNPFVHDELARRTYGEMGQTTSHGTFVQFFTNDDHWLYYNPVERYDEYFFDSYHGGGLDWDIIRHSGLAGGDLVEWNKLLDLVQNQDLSDPFMYREATRLVDVVNFADYLLLNIYAGMEDWPNNNWTAARLRKPGSRFRFYVWDAEQSFSLQNPNYHDVLELDLETLQAPIALIYRGLKANPDFSAVMAARFREHFYRGGPLSDDAVMKLFLDLRNDVLDAVGNMLTRVPSFWIPGRRENVEKHLFEKGFVEFMDFPEAEGPTPRELPEIEIDLPDPNPNLIPDPLIDAKDLLEYLKQEKTKTPPESFVRQSWSDENWVRYDYSVNLGDLSLVSADFDSDGTIDLGCVNNGYGLISIFRNNGDGIFSQPVQTSGAIGSEALATADLDQDQIPDLVIANRVSFKQSLSTFRNNGDGTFTEISSIPINRTEETEINFPASIVLKDMDGDSDTDAVIGHQSSIKNVLGRPPTNMVSVYENDGGGNLTHAQTIFGGSAELLSRRSTAVEDFDGDQDLDIVVSNGDITLLLIENLGDLVFGDPVPLPTAGLQRYYSIVALDIEGDQDIDILASARANPTIDVYVNDGAGHLAPDRSFRINATLPETLLVDDFNSDSSPDFIGNIFSPLFLNPKGGFDLYTNDGLGGFASSETLYTASQDPLPRSLVSGDFDGDTDTDFAALDRYNGVLSVFLNQVVPQPRSADLNLDDRIDFLDLLEIEKVWGVVTAP